MVVLVEVLRDSRCGVLGGSKVAVDKEVLGGSRVVIVEGGSRVVVLVGILLGRCIVGLVGRTPSELQVVVF